MYYTEVRIAKTPALAGLIGRYDAGVQARTFWKTVTVDETDLLESFLTWLDAQGLRYCIIGGQAVNAYVEPVVSLDLDVVVATAHLDEFDERVGRAFVRERFPHSLNVSQPGSDLRIQVQLDPRYRPFVERALSREILGRVMPVAVLEDLLQGKVWAAQDPNRRASKRQKDLADIARILESYPHRRSVVPDDLLAKLI